MTATLAKIQGNQLKAHASCSSVGAATKEVESLSHSQDIPEGFCQCGCGRKTNLNPRTHTRYGLVKGQPRRYINGHHGRILDPEYIEEDRGHDTPCWIWQRAIGSDGYGNLGLNGKFWKAHRFIYQREVGPIPEGLTLDHLCRVRCCVNPDHLEPVTNAENVRRGAAYRRANQNPSNETGKQS